LFHTVASQYGAVAEFYLAETDDKTKINNAGLILLIA